MNNNNKIAESPFKDFIESELRAGVSTRQLSADLKEKGFEVSHSALSEYYKKHMAGTDQQTREPEQYEPEPSECIEFNPDADNREELQTMYNKQVQIVAKKQADFMAGKGRFPEMELKALKTLDDLLRANQVKRLD